jgi:hypothetical protein
MLRKCCRARSSVAHLEEARVALAEARAQARAQALRRCPACAARCAGGAGHGRIATPGGGFRARDCAVPAPAGAPGAQRSPAQRQQALPHGALHAARRCLDGAAALLAAGALCLCPGSGSGRGAPAAGRQQQQQHRQQQRRQLRRRGHPAHLLQPLRARACASAPHGLHAHYPGPHFLRR